MLCVLLDIPEEVHFQDSAMKELNQFANLKLSFCLLLTNMLRVDAELCQVLGDKTSRASMEFDGEFLVS